MTHTEAAAALQEAELQQHLDRDREDLADDERGPAELAEWTRAVQLLAADGAYDPDTDPFVQDELAAEAAAAETREKAERARQKEAEFDARAHGRSYVLEALEEANLLNEGRGERLGAEGPLVLFRPEDGRAWDHLSERNWRAAAILEGRVPSSPPDPETFPLSVRAHSALLTAMAQTGRVYGFDPAHAVRLAQADPDAVLALAQWIEKAGSG